MNVFAAQDEYDELLRYAVVVPSYPHLPSLTVTGTSSSGPSPAVSHPVQTASTQARFTGGVHIVASTEVVTQTAGTDVITVCPPVNPTAYVEPSASSRSSVHGKLDFLCKF